MFLSLGYNIPVWSKRCGQTSSSLHGCRCILLLTSTMLWVAAYCIKLTPRRISCCCCCKQLHIFCETELIILAIFAWGTQYKPTTPNLFVQFYVFAIPKSYLSVINHFSPDKNLKQTLTTCSQRKVSTHVLGPTTLTQENLYLLSLATEESSDLSGNFLLF